MSHNLLDTESAAEMLGVKPTTLRIWRTQKKGPVFLKIGALVRYEPATVLAWRTAQTRASTYEKAAPVSATA